MTQSTPYKRILLKISGEMLVGSQKFGIAYESCQIIASAIQQLRDANVEVAIVIGGGNIFRGVGLREMGMPRTPADQIGMLSTLINGIALQQTFIANGCPTKVMSALECPKVAEPYNWSNATKALDDGYVVIFVGGTGNPYFTTDTAAALRASEIHADILLKATKVDGIYDKDPMKHSDAVRYDTISYSRILAEKLEVIDATAAALCMSNKIPMLVFNMNLLDKQQILTVLQQQKGTLVKEK